MNIVARVEEVKYASANAEMMIGLDLPHVGWAKRNEEELITVYKGFNLALGYSQKNYFELGLRVGQFNPYWGWGTILLIIPYVEVGRDYIFTPNEEGNFWTAGGAIGLYGARLSLSYRF
ncbi:hypothetical protein BX659_105144 [Orenia metallireducens]|jgi:hypothetical protein|uniref:Uncharacterized protein n=1 Tax=Orenia metallireducens TaxID=1413210 RepID=A0A285G2Z2_9FIRM|nr:hypothetical protein [Orenia metallireducens]PRX31813.1 hypothetical protein BX659_105144 [Orenia metallireducens]SNY17454.1 hypothetical protein SAMN06265827_104144 [Orenia metallireducens]